MSVHDPIVKHSPKFESVDYIVPERIREAIRARGLTYNEAADKCEVERHTFGLVANGHIDIIPKEYIFNLMKGLDFPEKFFYQLKWVRD